MKKEKDRDKLRDGERETSKFKIERQRMIKRETFKRKRVRQRDREKDRQRDRERDRETEREIEREIERETEK